MKTVSGTQRYINHLEQRIEILESQVEKLVAISKPLTNAAHVTLDDHERIAVLEDEVAA